MIRRAGIANSSWTAHVLLLAALLIFEAKWIVGDQFGEIAQPAEGDNCVLRSGETGVCRRPESCEWLPQPIVHHRSLENSDYCVFNGTEAIVCCPLSNLSGTEFANKACQKIQAFRNRLVHGLDGQEAEVPFIAALGINRENPGPNQSSYAWFCGSNLITSSFLLTAAHCLPENEMSLIVRMGSSNLLQGHIMMQDRKVKRTFPHPNYTSHSKENDIALIEVDHPFIFSANVMGICLSTNEEDRDETDQLFAAGWGATDYKTASPEKLMRVALTTVPLDKCREQYKLLQSTSFSRKFKINDTQYCAITKPTNETFKRTPCKGDSGGPLYYESNTSGRPNYLLVGIISAGINCGENIPEPYVRVASYLDWIDSVIETL